MSTRLTTHIRECITKAVMVHRFSAPVLALKAEKGALAVEVYNDLYTKEQQAQMNALPKGWLPETNNIGVRFGASGFSYGELYFDGYIGGDLSKTLERPLELKSAKRVPHKHYRCCVKTYEVAHRLTIKSDKLVAKEADLLEQIKTAKRSVEAALSAATTIKRLLETWPEIAPFALKFEGDKPQLPALPTQHLNSILDLPIEEAA